MTSSGLWAPTYTRPSITSTVRTAGTHHHAGGRLAATTHPTAATRMTCPDGKLGPDDGHVATAQHRADLAGAGPLTDREVVGHLLADDPLDDELEPIAEHHADGDGEVTVDERDDEAGDRADDEVAELHRQPEQRVEPVGQPVDGVEHAATRPG